VSGDEQNYQYFGTHKMYAKLSFSDLELILRLRFYLTSIGSNSIQDSASLCLSLYYLSPHSILTVERTDCCPCTINLYFLTLFSAVSLRTCD
jgi:hypothetical protein